VLCPLCRRHVGELEEAAATTYLAEGAAVAVSEELFDQILNVATSTSHDAVTPDSTLPRSSDARAAGWPAPLHKQLHDLGEERWEEIFPSVKRLALPQLEKGVSVQLIDFGARSNVFEHQHGGTELTLVLQGGYSNGREHYQRGDVDTADAGSRHGLKIAEKENCIALLVQHGPIAPKSVVGHVAKLWMTLRRMTGRADLFFNI